MLTKRKPSEEATNARKRKTKINVECKNLGFHFFVNLFSRVFLKKVVRRALEYVA